MAYLPGEKMLLELTQKGQDAHQAVGHLTDGTMIVVEHASNYIGQTVEIEFIRSLQTAAGKMMFARLIENKPVQTPKKLSKPRNFHSDRNINHKPREDSRVHNNKRPQGDQNLINLVNEQKR
jgi:hypothetical protein